MKTNYLIYPLLIIIVFVLLGTSCKKDNPHVSVNNVTNKDTTNTTNTDTSGTFTDSRDNRFYKWVKIGNQVWMAENLNVGAMVIDHNTGSDHSHQTNNGIIEKYCYDNDVNNCAKYGGLYEWKEMMQYQSSSSVNPSGRQGICPDGWHLPSDAEWTELVDYIGGISIAGGKLKEMGAMHWLSPNTGATNETGFSALPGGARGSVGTFSNIGYNCSWWSATEGYTEYAWFRNLGFDTSYVGREWGDMKLGISVRCVKD